MTTCRYGGGPEILRDLVKQFGISSRLEPELYPFELCFYLSSNMQDPIVIITKKTITVNTLKKRVSTYFIINFFIFILF